MLVICTEVKRGTEVLIEKGSILINDKTIKHARKMHEEPWERHTKVTFNDGEVMFLKELPHQMYDKAIDTTFINQINNAKPVLEQMKPLKVEQQAPQQLEETQIRSKPIVDQPVVQQRDPEIKSKPIPQFTSNHGE